MILRNLFAALLCLSPVIHAQLTYMPEPAWGPASVSIEGQALFVQGGKLTQYFNFTITQQAFLIDLSKPWDVSSPLYTKMQDGVAGFQHPNALTNNNNNWLILANQTLFTYNLGNQAIMKEAIVPESISLEGFGGVVDPAGNLVVPSGFNSSGNLLSLEYFPEGARATSTPSYPPLAGYRFYAITKSTAADAAFVFGGYHEELPRGWSAALLRYRFRDSTWAPMNTFRVPIERDSPCLVSAYNGTKLVLFGGIKGGLEPMSDIYIYDVVTNSWTQGEPGTSTRARASAACGVSGDYFITFGGYANKRNRLPPQELTSVYNLKSNTWVTRYEPPSFNTSFSSDASGLSVGAIAGAAIGGVAVVAGVIIFVLYRKRQMNKASLELKPWPAEHAPRTERGGSAHVCHAKAAPKEENDPLMMQQYSKKEDSQVFHLQDANQSQLNEMEDKELSKGGGSPTGSLRGPQYVEPKSFGGQHQHPSTFGEPLSKARDPQAPYHSVYQT
ncbi:hypothetical protein BG003_006912 [Podila horticola]|nr:hypothetical protein BG003_006912 [Podila horticola]